MINTLIEIFLAAILVMGGIFGLIGSYGLLRLKDPMQRLHAPTKSTTLGVGATLIVSALGILWTTGNVTWHEILVSIFLFVTAPLTAIYLAKTHLHLTLKRDEIPKTGNLSEWASCDRDMGKE